jgi:UDP-N-acetyl-D-mannosaminuronate dehydrogenase
MAEKRTQTGTVIGVDGTITKVTIEEGSSEWVEPPTEEQVKDVIEKGKANVWRRMRDQALAKSDYVVAVANETGGSVSDEWKAYRQALRDLPTHKNWPNLEDDDFPNEPGKENEKWDRDRLGPRV